MIIFKKAQALTEYVLQLKKHSKSIGFVPTMGALHEGHFSLIRWAGNDNDLVVSSIYINPTQFNKKEDFDHYPVTLEKDIEGLVMAGCNVLFLPTDAEIYPPHYQKKNYSLGAIETVLEGKYRPGHFQGVCQVVDRLLQIVQPEKLYLGQKDYQQCMVITKLLQLINKEEIKLIIAPTIREKDGLAMSSRNLRLNKEQRSKASCIYSALMYVKNNLHQKSFSELQEQATRQLEEEGFTVDYVAIAEANSLKEAMSLQKPLIALAAASIGSVRLIDNMFL